jgi:hypothetical protein
MRAGVTGKIAVWSILAGSGILSALLAAIAATASYAPWVYSALPLAIGLFVWRKDWTGGEAVSGEALLPG